MDIWFIYNKINYVFSLNNLIKPKHEQAYNIIMTYYAWNACKLGQAMNMLGTPQLFPVVL